jgi:hypothetical protein
MPTVAWKPVAPRLDIASVRVRCDVPMSLLSSVGWQCEVFDASRSKSYDVVVFQKAYAAEDLALAEDLLSRGTRVIFDLCDNHFYNPDSRPELTERATRLRAISKLADAVSISSPKLEELVDNDRIFLIDDALDPVLERAPRPLRRRWLSGDAAHLVWFGNPGSTSPPSGLIDLERIVPDLNRLNLRIPVALTVVTSSKRGYQQHTRHATFPTRFVKWKYKTFGSVVAAADACVLPVNVNPFTICKTSNRLVTSLMLGVPIVADLIPSYEEFEPFVLVGGWCENLERYLGDPELRDRHVEIGRSFIRARFAPEVTIEQWTRAIDAVLS